MKQNKITHRMTAFELLGILVSSDLRWTAHVEAIVANTASRLQSLKQLKRAGAPIRDLLLLVLQHACPVRHSGLTVAQSDVLESPQKRARCTPPSTMTVVFRLF